MYRTSGRVEACCKVSEREAACRDFAMADLSRQVLLVLDTKREVGKLVVPLR